ncbi:MAG TPA: phenylalanine--tRNA ligase subunit beta [Ilumatobacteraceae bacterium]|nr:phenylalanine--tRNA ligase subunit beta [Ilumatobacteraceae bacterium]
MKIVHSWLKELVPVGDDIEAIAEVMTDLGLAVEEIVHVGATVEGVITARVVRTERHPDAAKVHRVYVDAGDGRERHVWCGAFNMQAGDIVPLATPGTAMPDGRVIEPKPILGIQSDGMLCSARELGLGDDHAGIVILPTGIPLGVPYGEALGLATETVYDLDVTRNLPDCFGHRGVARLISGRLGVAVAPPPAPIAATPGAPARQATVELVDGDRCARFTSTVISGVRVVPSPEWMVQRLTAAGMRAINNVVDVSNYVMLELNQPNHAYDLDTLGGSGFRVRLARDGEMMTTLDGVERKLTSGELLICDATDTPIGLGGVMGGLDSEISEATTTIVLEVAWFEPIGIAKTASLLGLRSEASFRFDRGVDPEGMPAAIARFVELLRLTCPELVVHEGMVDAKSAHLPAPTTIDVRVHQVNALLGTSLSGEEMATLIRPVGFEVVDDESTLQVKIPSWRPDCTAEVDITEEVARQYGYTKVGKTVPKSAMHGRLSVAQARRRRLRDVLLGLGISEAMPNPFLADDDLVKAGLDGPAVRIVNSLVAEESVLRTTLRPGLLKAIAFNESHRRPGASLFEIGHAYPPADTELPAEYEELAVVLAGRDAIAAVEVWREIAAAMGFGARIDQSKPPAGMHPTRSATLSLGRDTIGAVGEIHPDVLDAYEVDERVATLELNLSILLALDVKVPLWKPTSRYPSSDLDLAFVTPDSVIAEKVEKAIKQSAGPLLVDLALFDVFRGPGGPEGSRSLAYRLRFQALDRTLGDAELTDLRNKVITGVTKLGATLRG